MDRRSSTRIALAVGVMTLAAGRSAPAQPAAPARAASRGVALGAAAVASARPSEGPIPVVTPISGLLALSVGRGLRFNNPYRLETPLGDTAESVSLAATYLDVGGALLFGPRSFRHGMSVGGGIALQGIGQFVLTPSYLALFGLSETVGLRGRVGVPIVIAPDTTSGLEAAVGSSLDMAYGLGALVELVGSVYFGAATDQTSITTIPMLSLQIGVFFDHQVRP